MCGNYAAYNAPELRTRLARPLMFRKKLLPSLAWPTAAASGAYLGPPYQGAIGARPQGDQDRAVTPHSALRK
jgi:hypothetical protein